MPIKEINTSPDEKLQNNQSDKIRSGADKKPRMFSDLYLCCWGLFKLEHFAPKCLILTKSDPSQTSNKL